MNDMHKKTLSLSLCLLLAGGGLAYAEDPPKEQPPTSAPAPAAEPTPTPAPEQTPGVAPEQPVTPEPPAKVEEPAKVPPPAMPPPPTTPTVKYVMKRRWGLFAAGTTLLVAAWMTDVGLTYGFGHQPGWTSIIPIVGPFIQMSETFGLQGPPINSGDPAYDRKINGMIDDGNTIIRALVYTGLAVDVAFQLAGVTMMVCGATLKRPKAVYASTPPGQRVTVVPTGSGLRVTW
jgi:hypothetical protein